MSLSGNINSIAKFTEDLRRLPRVVAQKVVQASAPALTSLALQTFDAGETPYGDAWKEGADGQRITLDRSGALKRQIKYVGIGTKLRVALGVKYAKYQIGKRPVFPTQGGALPVEYVTVLQRTAVDIVRGELGS